MGVLGWGAAGEPLGLGSVGRVPWDPPSPSSETGRGRADPGADFGARGGFWVCGRAPTGTPILKLQRPASFAAHMRAELQLPASLAQKKGTNYNSHQPLHQSMNYNSQHPLHHKKCWNYNSQHALLIEREQNYNTQHSLLLN